MCEDVEERGTFPAVKIKYLHEREDHGKKFGSGRRRRAIMCVWGAIVRHDGLHAREEKRSVWFARGCSQEWSYDRSLAGRRS
jgi:hypothetical protein